MKNNLSRKGLVIGILCLLLVIGLTPLSSAIAENVIKEDSSKSTSQSLWPDPGKRYVIVGIMEVISSNDFYNFIHVRVILPIWPMWLILTMKPFQYYEIKDVTGYYTNYFVFIGCSTWCKISPP